MGENTDTLSELLEDEGFQKLTAAMIGLIAEMGAGVCCLLEVHLMGEPANKDGIGERILIGQIQRIAGCLKELTALREEYEARGDSEGTSEGGDDGVSGSGKDDAGTDVSGSNGDPPRRYNARAWI